MSGSLLWDIWGQSCKEMWSDSECGLCSSEGAWVPAQVGARVTSRVDPEWSDRKVSLIIRNLQKYFYFHKKFTC